MKWTAGNKPKIGVRKLAGLFSSDKTQISTILKNKGKIMETYGGQNASAQKCHKRNRDSSIHETLHAWFCLAVSKNVYPNGSILKNKALEIAGRVGCKEFKGSNRWLDH
jgi:hypothetical protein